MIERDRKPRYLSLYENIRDDIVEGRYRYGEKLPSKRLFSIENGVSVITTEHAYDLLLEEGYIESRERSGYFVIFREDFSFPVAVELSLDEAMSKPYIDTRDRETYVHTADHDTLIDSSITMSDEGMPYNTLSKAIRRALTEYQDKICYKSPSEGIVELRQALSDYLRRSRGINVSKEQIIIGSGAEYLYGLIVQILGRDYIYGLEDPSYDKIRRIYQANLVDIDKLKMGSDGIESRELKRTDARVLHVTPFNSFPRGVTASASKRQEYIRWALNRQGFIIEDDYDSEFSMSMKVADTLFSLEPRRTVLYLNSFSKTIAPSFRMAYMVLPLERVYEFKEKINFYSCSVPVLEQYVISLLLSSGDFERHINRIRRKRRKEINA